MSPYLQLLLQHRYLPALCRFLKFMAQRYTTFIKTTLKEGRGRGDGRTEITISLVISKFVILYSFDINIKVCKTHGKILFFYFMTDRSC